MALSDSTVDRFMTLFNESRPDIERLMDECYSPRVLFRDPLVECRGTEALARYLEGAYANVTHCEFSYGEPARNRFQVLLPWTMTLEHRRLSRGAPILVDGVSVLQGDADAIEYHRDYYDAGQLIYENIPALGSIIRWIRRQAA